MKATKILLLKLQKIDDEIDALKAEEESIPDKKQEIEEGLKAIEMRVKQAQDESLGLAKARKDLEIQLEANNETMNKFQSQLYQVKSNREYEALQHEINDLKEKSSGLEDKILETLERTEQLSKQIRQEEDALKHEGESAEKQQSELDQQLRELKDRIAVKSDERVRLVADLEPKLLKQYERIRKSKGGIAVTSVENGACGGCFRRIPPHEMQNLKKDDRILTCEGCGRIIIWKWE
jgi:predicted  nucleic acid-binding Zn-ribbon protein